jgi:hypothetical protein
MKDGFLRCSICDKIISDKQSMIIFYDKFTDIWVCKVHKEVKRIEKYNRDVTLSMIKDKPITLEQQLIYEAKQRKFKG